MSVLPGAFLSAAVDSSMTQTSSSPCTPADTLQALIRGLAKDGQALTSPEAVEARAVELVHAFLAQTLPAWQRLGVG